MSDNLLSVATIAAVEDLQLLGREARIRSGVCEAALRDLCRLNAELFKNGKVAYVEDGDSEILWAYHAYGDAGPVSRGTGSKHSLRAERAPEELGRRIHLAHGFWTEAAKAKRVAQEKFYKAGRLFLERIMEWDDG